MRPFQWKQWLMDILYRLRLKARLMPQQNSVRQAGLCRMQQLERLIRSLGNNSFQVQSETHSNRSYLVSMPSGSCTCPDFKWNLHYGELGDCKHILAVRMAYPEGSA